MENDRKCEDIHTIKRDVKHLHKRVDNIEDNMKAVNNLEKALVELGVLVRMIADSKKESDALLNSTVEIVYKTSAIVESLEKKVDKIQDNDNISVTQIWRSSFVKFLITVIVGLLGLAFIYLM